MVLNKVIKALEVFEDPEHPLLGPNLKGLYFLGLWRCGSKTRIYVYNVLHVLSVLIVISEYVEIYMLRKDLSLALMNFSMSGLSAVTLSKVLFFLAMHSKWSKLVKSVSREEISAIKKNEPYVNKIMAEYTKYSRIVTYSYWALSFSTLVILITSPALKYVIAPHYREQIANGTEPLPQIISSWVPFDKTKMPGYLGILIIHIFILTQGSGVLATFDANAVTLMSFLKGQARIITEKCMRIFGEEEHITEKEIMDRIKECHRHHNLLKNIYEEVNSVLSPVMFLYVLVCSMTICCTVVQLSLDITLAQRIWVVEYTIAQAFQLFFYCWHSNEVAVESDAITRGVFQCKWWRSNQKQLRLVVLLMCKMDQPYILTAGPFTTLSVPTFIDLMKGSYSFYTLFSQMQDN